MGKHTTRGPVSTGTKIAVSAGTIGLAAVAVGAGVYASWNTTGNLTTGTYTAASVTSSFASTGTPTFSSAVSNMVPGDYAVRYADLQNTGSVALTFSLASSGSGTLANALALHVYKCATAYDGDGLCGGADDGTEVTSGTSVSQSNLALGSIAASGHVYLKMVATLPSNADQATYAGTSGTITLTETGVAASGTAR
ncbi:MAG TPA: hypothetical protein VFQ85_09025 [Mycobacteriales bacterium]|jgi:hypothetical protein|nr:hypothetical protein [Mycobacteriales bacterium]